MLQPLDCEYNTKRNNFEGGGPDSEVTIRNGPIAEDLEDELDDYIGGKKRKEYLYM
jgi:hypothetical protein